MQPVARSTSNASVVISILTVASPTPPVAGVPLDNCSRQTREHPVARACGLRAEWGVIAEGEVAYLKVDPKALDNLAAFD